MTIHRACLCFHPVGQGLFSTGRIVNDREEHFQWFYDCGTSSRNEVLERAIDHHKECRTCCHPIFEWFFRNSPMKMDLGVISHFDNDHISGISQLLSGYGSLKTLLMPYATLAQRLFYAFKQTNDMESEIVSFCANPIAFARERWRAHRILIVPGGATSGGVDPMPGPVDDNELGEGIWLHVGSTSPPDEEYTLDAANAGNVGVLPVGSRLHPVAGRAKLWEFRLYNDQHLISKLNEPFEREVRSLHPQLLAGDLSALRKAKSVYDRTFGNCAVARNEISLFIYAQQLGTHLDGYCHAEWGLSGRYSRDKMSILYTGDGFLDTPERSEDLMRTMAWRSLVMLQVPHHGSKSAWRFENPDSRRRPLASDLDPKFSIFCADPTRKSPAHPNVHVLLELLEYGPCIVDQTHAFCAYGEAEL